MEERIAVIGIIIEDVRQAEHVNALLHQFGTYIIGRMGIPYKEKQLNIISIVVDAPSDVISALSGKLGRLPGVSSKALYSKIGNAAKTGNGVRTGNDIKVKNNVKTNNDIKAKK